MMIAMSERGSPMPRFTLLRSRWTGTALSVFSSLLAASLAGSALRAADCNSNGVDDLQDIAAGTSSDCNSNATPDECDAQPGHVSFELAQTYAGLISRVTVADLDGDGLPDLVSSRPKNPDVVWLRNEGGATFAPPAELGVGFRANHVTAADLDGDHDMDLIAVEEQGTQLAVLLNAGNAAFTKLPVIALAESGGKPEAADLDADGDLDIVVPSSYGAPISTLINEGASGFSGPVVSTPPAEWAWSIVLRDLDGDSDIDLATANAGDASQPGSTVSVFRNPGNGAFGEPETFGVGVFPTKLLAEDLNGDSRLDLVSLNDSSEDVSVLLGQANGRFCCGAAHRRRPLP
jgi:hypothetical protein